jgi:hypothetical protein
MADTNLSAMPDPPPDRTPPLPAVIRLDPNAPLRFSPLEMRILKAQTGREFSELMQDDDGAKFMTLAWFRLRREGWPELQWSDLEACEFELGGADQVSPLNGQPPTLSPPSAGIGG